MTLKVIGAGLGRTGTMSLKLALEALGIGRCYHMVEVFAIPGAAALWERAALGDRTLWGEIFQGFSATVDWPSASFYEPLAQAYPKAKIILSLRDPEQWFESTQNTIFKGLDERMADQSDPWARMVKLVVGDMFDGDIHNRARAIAVFNAHNEKVRRIIPKERLLIYETGSGWEPLCRFLDLPVPATPYPKVNTTEDFAARVASMVAHKAP